MGRHPQPTLMQSRDKVNWGLILPRKCHKLTRIFIPGINWGLILPRKCHNLTRISSVDPDAVEGQGSGHYEIIENLQANAYTGYFFHKEPRHPWMRRYACLDSTLGVLKLKESSSTQLPLVRPEKLPGRTRHNLTHHDLTDPRLNSTWFKPS